ncbi:protein DETOXIFICATION 51-like [Rutidosis leptorrhynchoides]|uniref:protein DETOXIFICATION 51-like n=1 Tax=Rutidosis leptorrhynchoides TaxID=125765 RepID=UPI003A9A482B
MSQKTTTTMKFSDCLPPPSPPHQPPPPENIPTLTQAIHEAKSLFKLSSPIGLTALILYTRSIVSMLFLGHLSNTNTELAAGSLAIAFANITGYSVLSGLALGMEPLCSQAFGAHKRKLISITLHRTVIFLLVVSIPITFLWLNSSRILIYLHQDPNITRLSQTYLIFSIPDLLSNSFIHPTRIYLRAQGITYPVTIATLIGTAVQLPLNYMLVLRLRFGVAGVATASSVSNFVVLVVLVVYVWWAGLHLPTWANPTQECLTGWQSMIRLALPSCVSVCLEWWYYEIMILLCGLLVDPKSSEASMGVLIQTTSFLYVFPSSLGFAVSTRVGNEIGANRPDKARISALVSLLLAGLMGLSAIIFTTLMKRTWAQMFTNDLNILLLTSNALPIIGLCELGNCLQTVGCGVLRGVARPATAANVNLGAFYIIGMPVAVGLGFGLRIGFVGLWDGLLAAQVCCAGLMLYVVGNINWEQEVMKAEILTCKNGTIGEIDIAPCVLDCNNENEPPISKSEMLVRSALLSLDLEDEVEITDRAKTAKELEAERAAAEAKLLLTLLLLLMLLLLKRVKKSLLAVLTVSPVILTESDDSQGKATEGGEQRLEENLESAGDKTLKTPDQNFARFEESEFHEERQEDNASFHSPPPNTTNPAITSSNVQEPSLPAHV